MRKIDDTDKIKKLENKIRRMRKYALDRWVSKEMWAAMIKEIK